MATLKNKHRKSDYFHPLTGMCYRKRKDGKFEFFLGRSVLLKSKWRISGIRSGFKQLKTHDSSKEKFNARKLLKRKNIE